MFLPSPLAVFYSLLDMADSGILFEDIFASTGRVFAGFILATIFSVPLGILMGSFPSFCALCEPLIAMLRYMPAAAFSPLLIIYLGIEEAPKIAFIFIGVTIIGFMKHGLGYLKLFVPSGVPMVLLPLIVVIEIISYLSRPISLSVRLFANMMAGHTMMKVFGGFVVSLGIVGGWLPLGFSVALTGLEILVAFLQAYVFAILTCIYLNDALNLHH